MSTSYFREELGNGIGFTSIIDPKFKTNTFRVKFITKLDEYISPKNTLAISVLCSCNSKYKTLAELSKKLNALYGSALYGESGIRGDNQIISMSMSCIEDRYAIEQEKIFDELFELFELCLFKPNATAGAFDSREFSLKKRDLIETIKSEINNKRGYAVMRSRKTIFTGEPLEFSVNGTIEIAQEITSAECYEAYLDFLRYSQVEVFFVGPKPMDNLKEKIKKVFSQVEREVRTKIVYDLSPLKEVLSEVTEELDVNQSKMVMALKSTNPNKYANSLMSKILGGTTFSKLFVNVREKLSLCYYCSAMYMLSKGTLVIDSGVEQSNIEKAKNEILNQLNEIKLGNFTDEDIENTVLYIANSLKSVGDTPSSLVGWYMDKYYLGEVCTPYEEIKKYEDIKREDIIEAAKSFELDTVYIMNGKNDNMEEEE